jgi:hypothetical protein
MTNDVLWRGRANDGAQVLTTKVALRFPGQVRYEEWERAGRLLAGVLSSSSWWLGDWLIYGKDHFSDRYEQAVQVTGLRYQTLRNYAWVARSFPAIRRRSRLSFQHHAEVASLTIAEQERWLQHAQDQRWSIRQLRMAVRPEPADQALPAAAPATLRRLTLQGERLHRWREAAEQSGTDFDKWVLATLDDAAEQALTT